MKKTARKILVLSLCSIFIFLCGCTSFGTPDKSLLSDKKTAVIPSDVKLSDLLFAPQLPEIQYSSVEPIMFSADENGGIVCMERDGGSLKRYNADGKPEARYDLPQGFSVHAVACGQSNIYLLGDYTEEKKTVILSLASNGEFNTLYENRDISPDFSSQLVFSDNTLYFSLKTAEKKDIEFEGGFYRYDGARIFALDVMTLDCKDINADYPVSFAAREMGIMLLCCDEQGFYFIDRIKDFGEKHYTSHGELSAFCPIGENVIAFSESGCIKAALINGEISSVLSEDHPFGGQPFAMSMGCLIYNSADENGNNSVIKRVRACDLIKNLYPIDVIMSLNTDQLSDAAGYALNESVISEDELALKLLSGDADWDAALIYSRQSLAYKTAEKGVFYPLNGQAEEYIKSNYPSVQRVCQREGEIWAIPLEVNIGCILYNKEKCLERGINFSDITTGEFLSESRRLCENTQLKGTAVSINWDLVSETVLGTCIGGSGVDKEALSELAPLLKENANIVKQPEYMQPAVSKVFDDGSVIVAQSNAYSGDNDNFLYETMLSRAQAEYLSELNPALSAAPIPVKGKTSGYCFLLAVNPYSDNLEETLRFVFDISAKRLETLNSGKGKEMSCYEELEEIYKNSEIIMGLPQEIWYSDYEKYLEDAVTLEEFVLEADRKVSTYLNE